MISQPARTALRTILPLAAGALALALTAGPARAQVGPSPFPSGGPGGEEEPKKEGVAEAAPKTPGLLPTTPALPAPKSARKKFELLELDGYFRLRTDWFKNFHLGFDDNVTGGAPFPRSTGCVLGGPGVPCENSISSANMRLRLEPTINLEETTSVHLQVDVFDNLVLGSTPDGFTPNRDGRTGHLGAFDDSQAPPQAGLNEERDAIRVKRAWGEMATPVGLLKFGRMPDHWGLGMVHNSGDEDPINGGYNLDGDFGDSVDRAIFSTLVPGTRLRAAVGLDWPFTGLVSSQDKEKALVDHAVEGGQPWDLDNDDDVTQWTFVLSRLDSPTEFGDALDRGELAINYGAYVGYRTQDWELTSKVEMGTPTLVYTNRAYKAYTPDLWLKVGYGDLLFEAEAAGQVGSLRNDNGDSIDLRQFGAIGRGTFKAVEDKLRVGLEVGFASGDQWDNVVPGRTNIRNGLTLPPAGDSSWSRFVFDRDYHVDLILFRELIGAVNNAIYFKPFLSYELTDTLVMRVSNVTSVAAKPVATPGNGSMYGVEFDGDLGYEGQSFFAGISYGVLFPLSAMSHPADLGYATGNAGDAGNAHTIQSRLVLRF